MHDSSARIGGLNKDSHGVFHFVREAGLARSAGVQRKACQPPAAAACA